MTKKAYDKIAGALKEAIAIAEGTAKPARVYVPPEINVRATRAKLKLSQEQFAALFGFTLHQIRQWEQGRCRPTGPARAYLMIIDRAPAQVLKLLRGSAHKAA